MKWGGNGKYKVPGDPDLFTRLGWAIEDWWRELRGEERLLLGLMLLATALMALTLRFGS